MPRRHRNLQGLGGIAYLNHSRLNSSKLSFKFWSWHGIEGKLLCEMLSEVSVESSDSSKGNDSILFNEISRSLNFFKFLIYDGSILNLFIFNERILRFPRLYSESGSPFILLPSNFKLVRPYRWPISSLRFEILLKERSSTLSLLNA